MKIDDYRLLVMVKKEGTIRGAAKKLHISQPAISQRLKQIEDQWGEQLFLRTHKQVMITPVGEKVLLFAEEILEKEAILKDEIAIVKSRVQGRLSLGVSSMVGQYALPAILEKFMVQFPDVEIDLVTGLSEQIRHSSNDLHIIIVRGDEVKGLNCHELFTDRLFLIDKKTPETPSERPFIEFQSDPGFHSLVDDWFTENPVYQPSRKIKVDQIETCKQLMAHGIGMTVLPEISVKELSPEFYNIRPLMVNGENITRKTWVCTSEQAKRLPQVKAFLEIL